MKNVLTLILIAFVPVAASAENSVVTPNAEAPVQKVIFTELKRKDDGTSEQVIVENESDNLELWNELDINKDKKLNYIEFSRLFY